MRRRGKGAGVNIPPPSASRSLELIALTYLWPDSVIKTIIDSHFSINEELGWTMATGESWGGGAAISLALNVLLSASNNTSGIVGPDNYLGVSLVK